MRGEAVAEGVRTDGLGDAVALGQVFHDEEDHLAGEACAATVEEHHVGILGLHVDVPSRTFYILVHDFQAALADGHQSFLAALAEDAEEAVVFVDVADLQSDELGDAQAAAVHHLNHGLVAVAVGLAEVDAVNHLLDFLVGQHLGQVAAKGGRGDEQGGVEVGQLFLVEVAPERFQSRKDAGLRGGAYVQVVEVGKEVLDGFLLDVVYVDGLLLAFEVLQKQMDIVPIGLHAVVGQRELKPKIVGVVLDEVRADIDRVMVHSFSLQK